MTEPITTTQVKTPVKKEAYVQVGGGVNNYGNTTAPDIGVTLGGQVSKNGTYAKTELGCGTALKAKVEVGHEFGIGKNMGLELSANAEYVKQSYDSKFTSNVSIDHDGQHVDAKNEHRWHDGVKKAGGALMMTFNGKKGNIKAGVEMGGYANSAPNVTDTYNALLRQEDGSLKSYHVETKYNAHQAGFYATPKVSGELNIGKKGNWSIVADGDLFGGNAGVRYTF